MCEQNQDLLEQPWKYPQLFEENKKQNQYLQKFSSAVLNGENSWIHNQSSYNSSYRHTPLPSSEITATQPAAENLCCKVRCQQTRLS